MIRVVRLMEYTYPSVERMEADMSHWAVQGTRSFGGQKIKSVTLPLEIFEDDSE